MFDKLSENLGAEENIMKEEKEGYYSWDEIQKLLNYIRSQSFDHYVFFFLLSHSGRRVSEITGRKKMRISQIKRRSDGKIITIKHYPSPPLKVKDIDFERGGVNWTILKQYDKVGDEKIHRRKFIKLNAEALELLDIYIKKRKLKEDDVVFPFFWSAEQVYYYLSRYVKEAGLKKKKRLVHALRHSWGIHLGEKAKNILQMLAIKRQLAHVNFKNTLTYLRHKEDDSLIDGE